MGACPVRTFCGQEDSSDADVRNFWFKNLRNFWNLWCVRTDKGEGNEPVRLQSSMRFSNNELYINTTKFSILWNVLLKILARF